MADQTLAAMARFGVSADNIKKAYGERVRIALLLRNMSGLSSFSENPEWGVLDEELKKRARALTSDYLLSGGIPSLSLIREVLRDTSDESNLQLLYRSKNLLPGSARQEVLSSIQSLCSQKAQSAVCRWGGIDAAEAKLSVFVAGLAAAPLTPESIEPKGNEFVQIDKMYRELENSGDPYLDSLVALKSQYLYSKFADFLLRIGSKNPALMEPLKQKANESQEAAAKFRQSCQNIAASASLPARYSGYCAGPETTIQGLNSETYLARQSRGYRTISSSDPKSSAITELQKKLFAEDNKSDALLSLAREYLRGGHFSHAAGAASYGLSLNVDSSEDLKVVLGCSLIQLGFVGEAKFQLGTSKSSDPQKGKCLKEASSI
jgi:hypothetical protein